MKLCGAKKRQGTGTCARPAGWGTDHPGFGCCKLHGGASPDHGKAAQRQQAAEAVELFGLCRDIGPHEALMEEVQWTAGDCQLLRTIVRDLRREQLTHGVTKTVQLPDGTRTVEARAAVNVWVELLDRQRQHLLRACKTAIEAGVERRRPDGPVGGAERIEERPCLGGMGDALAALAHRGKRETEGRVDEHLGAGDEATVDRP